MISISALIAVLSYAIAMCGIVPLFPWLPLAPRLALAVGMAAGVWQDRRGSWPIKNWMLNVAVIPVFLYYLSHYSRANPIQPVVSVLAIMLAVRLGGERSGRYYLQIHALSLFCLAASSLFDLSPAFLIYLSVMLLLTAVAMVLLTFYALDARLALPRSDMRTVLAAGLLMPLASLPLMAFFFPILPRTQIPLWNFLPSNVAQTSGMTDKVEPGRSSVVAGSRVLAFRAEMPRLAQPQLYWRGTVFNRLEGNRWMRAPQIPAEQIKHSGTAISQTIYPEPGQSQVLFALDAPVAVKLQRVHRQPDSVYELRRPGAKRLGYQAESVISGLLPLETRPGRDFYLQLPTDIPVRIQRLADDIRRRGNSDAGKVELLESYFRNAGYRYSMRDLPVGANALEQFLFEKKQGHCEFFASAYALLLRASGVPARLVAGYLGGDYNDLGGYYLITEDMAHVWVEAFIAGKGWVRTDPSSFAQNAGAIWGGKKKPDLLRKFRLALDSFNHYWNRTIIVYDFEQQVEVARSVGYRLHGLERGKVLKGVWASMLLLVALGGAVALYRRRKPLFPSREERILRLFLRRVERDCHVGTIQGQQGLFELSAACADSQVQEFVTIYAGAVYRDRKLTSAEYLLLKRIVREGFGKNMRPGVSVLTSSRKT